MVKSKRMGCLFRGCIAVASYQPVSKRSKFSAWRHAVSPRSGGQKDPGFEQHAGLQRLEREPWNILDLGGEW